MARDTRNCSDLWEGHGTVNEWKPWKRQQRGRRGGLSTRENSRSRNRNLSRGDICVEADAAVRSSFEKVTLYQKIYIHISFISKGLKDIFKKFRKKLRDSVRFYKDAKVDFNEREKNMLRVSRKMRTREMHRDAASGDVKVKITMKKPSFGRGTQWAGLRNVFRCRSKSRPASRLVDKNKRWRMERRTTRNPETMCWMNKNEIMAGGPRLRRLSRRRERGEPGVSDALCAFGEDALSSTPPPLTFLFHSLSSPSLLDARSFPLFFLLYMYIACIKNRLLFPKYSFLKYKTDFSIQNILCSSLGSKISYLLKI